MVEVSLRLIELILTVLMVVVALSIVFYAYLKHKIDIFALFGTLVLGLLILLTLRYASYAGLISLLAFFVLGNLVVRYKYEKKAMLGVAEDDKGMRGIKNVFGNGVSPLLFLLLYMFSKNPIYLLGFSGSVATACADTFSTEIGQTDGEPRLITSLQKVAIGTNGGVTLQGLFAALLGSCLISLSSLPFTISNIWLGAHSQAPSIEVFFIASSLAGFSGCIMDSFLGATLENRGVFRLNKQRVNFFSALFGGFLGIEFSYIIG